MKRRTYIITLSLSLSTFNAFYVLPSSLITHSTDTFYGTLCSGLTDKTILSFISSNSSFSECMRTHLHRSLSLQNAARYLEKTLLEEETHTSETAFTLRIGKKYTMKSCYWKDCSNDATGGAISYSSSYATSDSLLVQSCIFISCRSTRNAGGAISVTNIGTVTTENSYFEGCQCAYILGDCGGGAIYWGDVTTQPMIRVCNFIRCVAGDEGGALSTRTKALIEHFVMQNSQIIQCNGTNDDGGGILFGGCLHYLGCTGILFTGCWCKLHGGALYSDCFNSYSSPLIRFCFFTQNIAQLNIAHDCYTDRSGSIIPILHSFSTTQNNRVHPYSNEDNWLPLTNINVDLPSVRTRNSTTYTH